MHKHTVHECKHTHMHTYRQANVHTQMHICVHVYTHKHIYMLAHTERDMCMYVHMHTGVCVEACKRTHSHR